MSGAWTTTATMSSTCLAYNELAWTEDLVRLSSGSPAVGRRPPWQATTSAAYMDSCRHPGVTLVHCGTRRGETVVLARAGNPTYLRRAGVMVRAVRPLLLRSLKAAAHSAAYSATSSSVPRWNPVMRASPLART